MSLYALKPKFQNLLRPIVKRLFNLGVTANQVTTLALIISVALGIALVLYSTQIPQLYLALPLWYFLRMAFNAIDGMLAREFNQQSKLGAYLNELSDVVSDAAMVIPFAYVPTLKPILVLSIIFLAALSEYAGVLGCMVGAGRRYDGPSGKADRALIFGAFGLWLGITHSLPTQANYLLGVILLLLLLTILNRIKNGIHAAETSPNQHLSTSDNTQSKDSPNQNQEPSQP